MVPSDAEPDRYISRLEPFDIVVVTEASRSAVFHQSDILLELLALDGLRYIVRAGSVMVSMFDDSDFELILAKRLDDSYHW